MQTTLYSIVPKSQLITIANRFYPLFVGLAENALMAKDLRLFWLYSNLCDAIYKTLQRFPNLPPQKKDIMFE